MPEILLLEDSYSGTEIRNQDSVYTAHTEVDFPNVASNLQILSITSSWWLISKRGNAEGGSRTLTPRLWIELKGLGEKIAGPLHATLEFSGVSGISLYFEIPHFLLSNSRDPLIYKYDFVASCCYNNK